MDGTMDGTVGMGGEVSLRVSRQLGDLKAIHEPSLAWKVKNFFGGYRGNAYHVAADLSGKLFGLVTLKSSLSGRVFRPEWSKLNPEQTAKLKTLLAANFDVRELCSPFYGEVVDYGVLSRMVVTDAGVNYLAADFAGGANHIANFKYHGFGTGTAVELAADTALGTELTTQYATDNIRPTGSQSSASNVYTTIGTLSPDTGGTIAITEHGIFTQAATGGGTLWDRSKFAAVNLVAGSDSLQVTYNGTFSSGG